MTVNEAFDVFINSKKVDGLKDASIKDYTFCLRRFIFYLGNEFDIVCITERLVDDYILSLHHSQLAKATVCTYIRNLKVFLCYIQNNWGLSFNAKDIVIPRPPKKQVHIYDESEVVLLFRKIHSTIPWITARNRAIIALMLDSGMRQGEVCSLCHADISFESHRMKVSGKGDKERFVPLGNISARYLKDYFSLCPYSGDSFVFYTDDGKRLTGGSVKSFVFKLAKLLPFELTSHALRHNFATNYCLEKFRKGQQVDVYMLKILMGHESIYTTQNYIQCALEVMAVESSSSFLDTISELP